MNPLSPLLILGCVCLGLCASPGCGRSHNKPPPLSPTALAVEAAQRRTVQEVERAWKEAHSLPAYTLPVRYNPGRTFSTCPDFEVHYGGRWRRVQLNAPDELLELLANYREQTPGPQPPALWFVGSPTGKAERCPDSLQWVEVFSLEDIILPLSDPPDLPNP